VVDDAVARKRPRLGDVIEIGTEKGLGYFQYSSKDPDLGYLIRVLPGVFPHRVTEPSHLAANKELYFVFFPLGAAVTRGLVTIVANAPIPAGAARPNATKAALSIARGGRVLNWEILEDGKRRVVSELSDEERSFSPREIWNDTALAERIAKGWLPRDEANGP
jgi:hypothetical protein